MTTKTETYTLTIAALPNSTVPAIARLRRLLKLAFRACGFKCVRIVAGGATEDPPNAHRDPQVAPAMIDQAVNSLDVNAGIDKLADLKQRLNEQHAGFTQHAGDRRRIAYGINEQRMQAEQNAQRQAIAQGIQQWRQQQMMAGLDPEDRARLMGQHMAMMGQFAEGQRDRWADLMKFQLGLLNAQRGREFEGQQGDLDRNDRLETARIQAGADDQDEKWSSGDWGYYSAVKEGKIQVTPEQRKALDAEALRQAGIDPVATGGTGPAADMVQRMNELFPENDPEALNEVSAADFMERTKDMTPAQRKEALDTLVRQKKITHQQFMNELDDWLGDTAFGAWAGPQINQWFSDWTDAPARFTHESEGEFRVRVRKINQYPMFRSRAEAEKGHKHRHLPMASELAEMLLSVPEAERGGFVFNPLPIRNREGRVKPHRVSEIIVKIGEAAHVRVAERRGRVHYAGCHDLRRAFGFRWAMRVMSPVSALGSPLLALRSQPSSVHSALRIPHFTSSARGGVRVDGRSSARRL